MLPILASFPTLVPASVPEFIPDLATPSSRPSSPPSSPSSNQARVPRARASVSRRSFTRGRDSKRGRAAPRAAAWRDPSAQPADLHAHASDLIRGDIEGPPTVASPRARGLRASVAPERRGGSGIDVVASPPVNDVEFIGEEPERVATARRSFRVSVRPRTRNRRARSDTSPASFSTNATASEASWKRTPHVTCAPTDFARGGRRAPRRMRASTPRAASRAAHRRWDLTRVATDSATPRPRRRDVSVPAPAPPKTARRNFSMGIDDIHPNVRDKPARNPASRAGRRGTRRRLGAFRGESRDGEV